MRDTSGLDETSKRRNVETSKPAASTLRVWGMLVGSAFFLVAFSGCSEFVHMGQISDRELASSVSDVKIEQQQPDGAWKGLGHTDGNGKWWILKDKIKGGGRIRLSKPGYFSQTLGENEFLQGSSFLMVPSSGNEDEAANQAWH